MKLYVFLNLAPRAALFIISMTLLNHGPSALRTSFARFLNPLSPSFFVGA